ncbi:protein of unknown function (DUF4419) domain containing protein [Elaphomyces granulatus]|jgi:hypothetical protein
MPITIKPSNNTAEAWEPECLQPSFSAASSPEALLQLTMSDERDGYLDVPQSTPPPNELIQSSFEHLTPESPVFATKNGFVHACLQAYNDHHHLIIRPEDVWFSILTQLGAYVNAHAEELRGLFIQHQGQKELHIEKSLKGIDHGEMAFEMGKLIQGNIKDAEMRDWILPAFTTTTKVDEAVASMIFMGTLQKYFTYSWGTRCGLPSVTLRGEVGDWEAIRERAKKLATFGKEPEKWYKLLAPVLDGFVESFMSPEKYSVKRFWQSICTEHEPGGSGTTTYSGWITAFCFWDEQGICLHDNTGGNVELTPSDIPMGFTKVPVILLDGGFPTFTEIVAGSVAIRAESTSGDVLDTIQPEVGWFMYKIGGQGLTDQEWE